MLFIIISTEDVSVFKEEEGGYTSTKDFINYILSILSLWGKWHSKNLFISQHIDISSVVCLSNLQASAYFKMPCFS